MILIRDVMNQRVHALQPSTTLTEAVEFLVAHHVGGAPVVDDHGDFVGEISERALLDVLFDADIRKAPVSRHLTHELQVVGPDEPLSRAAQLFALGSSQLLPVVENGKLVGTIGCCDLINHALTSQEQFVEPLVELIPALARIS